MYTFLILAILFAALEAYATNNGLQKIEYIAKPAVIVCLFIWLYLSTGLHGAAFWFGLGILFALVGDIMLLWLDRFFLFGLAAFLFTHIFYTFGFMSGFVGISAWSFLLALILGISAARVLRRIVSSMRQKGETRLILPVLLYSVIITAMLYAAMLTLSDMTWKASASLLAAAGAFLFFMSDLILAWNKFVTPIARGRTLNIVLYHAGQILLIAGVVTQFG